MDTLKATNHYLNFFWRRLLSGNLKNTKRIIEASTIARYSFFSATLSDYFSNQFFRRCEMIKYLKDRQNGKIEIGSLSMPTTKYFVEKLLQKLTKLSASRSRK